MDPEQEKRFEEAQAALGEFLARHEAGEHVSIDDWCAARPHIAAELKDLHAECLRVRLALASTQGSGQAQTEVPFVSDTLARLARRSSHFAQDLRPGQVIAQGGMGQILSVRDEVLHRDLAMKVLRGGPPQHAPADVLRLARFLDEAQITGQLDHPGIVPVHELGLDSDGRVYFTMKLVKGRNLQQILELVRDREEGWNETRALGVLLKVCEAMAYAHHKGVVHRDLKPANVMVGRFGEVYVMDWGLAKAFGREDRKDLRIAPQEIPVEVVSERRELARDTPDSPLVTADGHVIGTPAYMPPEQAQGRVERLSARSDVYAIGAMLYHLLTRQMPFVSPGVPMSNRSVLARLLDGPPQPVHVLRPDVPAELEAICDKAMARSPEARYRDTLELAEDLRAYLEHRVVRAYQTGAVAELRKWVERNRGWAASIAAAFVLLVAGLSASLVFKARSDSNAALARKNERQARDEKERADREAEAATKKADEVLRLSALQKLEDLEAEADRLWPALPERLREYGEWLRDAEALMAELPGHDAKLAELRAKSRPWAPDQAALRAAHPRLHELEAAQRHLDYLKKRKTALSSGPPDADPTAAEVGVDLSSLPQDASELNELAWLLVDPERTDFGGEAKGLLLARRAVSCASAEAERAAIRETLAWALFASARFDDAVAEAERAQEECAAVKRADFEGYLEKLRAAVEAELSPEGIDKADRELAELEGRVAKLEAEVSARPQETWQFESSEDRWWHNQLVKVVNGLRAFADPETGLDSSGTSPEHGWGIPKRAQFARMIAERSVSGAEAAAKWAEATSSIADPEECSLYGGLRLTPQLGLLPIGRDPGSGLWEFAHLQTGEPAERGADGKLVVKEETGLVFVLLPGSKFRMGAQRRDPNGPNYDRAAERAAGPVQEVTLSPFFLSKYELTQGQWLRFTGRNPSYYHPKTGFGGKQATLLHPVEQVSWETCSETLGRLGLELPTEAQWEYAARAGTTSVWWTGNEKESLAGAANLADSFCRRNGGPSGWVYEDWLNDGYAVHAPVGSYAANAFGLHDVIGNVWEWCRDWYDDYGSRVRPGDGEREGTGSSVRVTRGGGFDAAALTSRSATRFANAPSAADNTLGVRPARSITP